MSGFVKGEKKGRYSGFSELLPLLRSRALHFTASCPKEALGEERRRWDRDFHAAKPLRGCLALGRMGIDYIFCHRETNGRNVWEKESKDYVHKHDT